MHPVLQRGVNVRYKLTKGRKRNSCSTISLLANWQYEDCGAIARKDKDEEPTNDDRAVERPAVEDRFDSAGTARASILQREWEFVCRSFPAGYHPTKRKILLKLLILLWWPRWGSNPMQSLLICKLQITQGRSSHNCQPCHAELPDIARRIPHTAELPCCGAETDHGKKLPSR